MATTTETMTLEQINLLEAWKRAQAAVRESQDPKADAFARARLARRVEWAAQLGRKCIKAGLVLKMS